MSDFSAFVANVMTGLGSTLTLYTFYPGNPPDVAPPASVAVGYVWVDRVEPDPDNALVEFIFSGVRLFPIIDERMDAEIPIDPSPLYDDAQTLQGTVQTGWEPSDSSPWFYQVMSIDFNHDEHFVDVVLRGTTWNASAVS